MIIQVSVDYSDTHEQLSQSVPYNITVASGC